MIYEQLFVGSVSRLVLIGNTDYIYGYRVKTLSIANNSDKNYFLNLTNEIAVVWINGECS